MSEPSEAVQQETNVNDLLAVGEQVRKRRGRPPGSKNKPRDSSEQKVNQSTQRDILAGALIAVFGLLGLILGWFGWEYYKKMELEEAKEGGRYLLPISQRVETIAKLANWISFPVWFLTQVNTRFRKVEAKPSRETAVSASPPPTEGNSANSGTPTAIDSPPDSSEEGFSPLPNDAA